MGAVCMMRAAVSMRSYGLYLVLILLHDGSGGIMKRCFLVAELAP